MKTLQVAQLWFLATACFWLVGCDPAYPPIIVNCYPDTVDISLSFVEGAPPQSGLHLPQNTEFVQRKKGLKIKEIKVKDAAGKLRIYGEVELNDARSRRRVDLEVWMLTEDGIRLGDRKDLREFLSHKH